MVCLRFSLFPFFFPFRSRPLIGGAGIAGKSGSPVSGYFGNRGKGISRLSLVRRFGGVAFVARDCRDVTAELAAHRIANDRGALLSGTQSKRKQT